MAGEQQRTIFSACAKWILGWQANAPAALNKNWHGKPPHPDGVIKTPPPSSPRKDSGDKGTLHVKVESGKMKFWATSILNSHS
jgi:hypothetical protein